MIANDVGECNNCAVTAEIFRHEYANTFVGIGGGIFYLFYGSKLLSVLRENRRLSAAERINALFDITDHESLAAHANGGKDAVLDRVDVLVLVDVDGVVVLQLHALTSAVV